jgi:DNA-binding XRE family transcriptional regulator
VYRQALRERLPEHSQGKSGDIEMGDTEGRLGSPGNRVRELRENKLMTQAQLARRAKVALRTIHSVEKGMNCRMDTKRKILLALGLRFEDKDLVFPPRNPSIFPHPR